MWSSFLEWLRRYLVLVHIETLSFFFIWKNSNMEQNVRQIDYCIIKKAISIEIMGESLYTTEQMCHDPDHDFRLWYSSSLVLILFICTPFGLPPVYRSSGLYVVARFSDHVIIWDSSCLILFFNWIHTQQWHLCRHHKMQVAFCVLKDKKVEKEKVGLVCC